MGLTTVFGMGTGVTPPLEGPRTQVYRRWTGLVNPPGARTALEIYPSALRKESSETGPFTNEHERDAVCSALAMWRHRETVAALCAATDPTTRLEGDIWSPTSSP